ncbi:hypothetical protein OGAPHI_001146 [Ogataea philodendri]|uniref:Uncharacterized protein n=1 Tax=Ogataea philodendri TaxID=1378263 RepID=A0A9P8PEW7_9ASCO|nr:uncharacterized protein OGAPHI_001146 [Ogataea philodendri]KAH3670631.1 hypothetical protein OGAPHI_001146 [Ogataea philodendri]
MASSSSSRDGPEYHGHSLGLTLSFKPAPVLWPGASKMVYLLFSVSKYDFPTSMVLPSFLSSLFVSMIQERYHPCLPASLASLSYFSTVLLSTAPVKNSKLPPIVLFPASTCPIKMIDMWSLPPNMSCKTDSSSWSSCSLMTEAEETGLVVLSIFSLEAALADTFGSAFGSALVSTLASAFFGSVLTSSFFGSSLGSSFFGSSFFLAGALTVLLLRFNFSLVFGLLVLLRASCCCFW